MKKALRIGALFVFALPLMGESCSEEKIVDVSLGMPATVRAIAEGSINDTSGDHKLDAVEVTNFKAENEDDIRSGLEDANINLDELSDA